MKVFLSVFLLSASAVAQPIITLRPIATSLASPVAITHAKDSRLFITQQTGGIVPCFSGVHTNCPQVRAHTAHAPQGKVNQW